MAAEDFLNGIENKQTLGDKIDASMISQASIPGFEQSIIDNTKQLSQPKEIGKQNFNDLYPGLSQNIQAGSYSGSEIGSGPIYVNAGNILALNPILERRKAQQEAATLRAKQLKPYTPPTPYQLKDIRYQNKIDEKFNSEVSKVVNDTYSQRGIEGNILLNDPSSPQYKKIAEIERAYNIYGKNFDEVTTTLAKIGEDNRNNTKLFPPEAKELASQFETMTGDVFGREGGFDNIEKVNQIHDKLQGYQTLANYLEKSIEWKDFEGAVSSKFNFYGGDKYLSHKTNKVTNFDGIRKQVADEIEDGVRPQVEAGLITRDQIEKVVNSRLQNKQEVSSAGVSELRDDNKDVSKLGEPVVSDPKNPQKPRISTFNRDGSIVPNGEVDYNELAYIPVSGFKPASIDQPMIINGSDMSYKLNDVVDFTLTGMATIEHGSKGDQRKVGYGKAKMNVDYYEGKPTDEVGKKGATEQLTKSQYEALSDSDKKNYSKKQKKQDVDVAVVLDEAAVGSIKASNKNAKIDDGITFLESKKTKGKKESSKSGYSPAQEENIKATMKANPGASREEAIKALDY